VALEAQAVAEVCGSVNTDLFIWHKRPININTGIPEVSASVKRGLGIWQKRPTNEEKRPLHTPVYLR
jgi:hypothetical protein